MAGSEPGARRIDQCEEWPSSLLLVEKRIAAKKTTMMTGTTKNGEVMSMVKAP